MHEYRDEALAPRTTLGIGGPTPRLLEVTGEAELLEVLRETRAAEHPPLLLGGGSNVVIADEGLESWVIHPKGGAIEREGVGDRVKLHVDAGVVFDELVAYCVEHGLADIECLSGIPGQVGATPLQNVGAYGQQVSDVLERIRVYDRQKDITQVLAAAECAFGYRDSAFKGAWAGRYVVLSVTMRLRAGDPAPAAYAELAQALEARGGDKDLASIRATVLEMRRSKGMVVDPDDADSHSAGSFFLNPLVETRDLPHLEHRGRQSGALAPDEELPSFDARRRRRKLPAAWLIEHAGFHKGHVHGGVGLSSKHALALVNRGGGTAREVVELAHEIRDAVFERFSVWLQPEPRFIGFSRSPFPSTLSQEG